MKLLQHFKELTIRPKNAKELKGLILKLAIQGNLTSNWRIENPNIKPTSELLEELKTEKKKLIKEKKIKAEKPLSSVKKEELIVNLPNSWETVRLGEIGDWGAGSTPLRSNSSFYGGEINWFKSGELNNSIMDYESKEKITKLALEKTSVRLNNPGDVLIAMYGATIGKTGILQVVGTTNQAVCACTPFSCITSLFLHLLLKGLKDTFINQGEGGAQPNISRVKIRTQVFGLPPLEEQKEIVKVVETLFKEVEQLEQLTVARIGLKEDFVTSALNQLTTNRANQEWTFLQNHFKSFFNEQTNIKKLRETVLQLAVQGKLTADWRANNPDTEDASQLLKRIKAERSKLISEKKLKKTREKGDILEGEFSLDLPNSWTIAKAVDLGFITKLAGFEYSKHINLQDEGEVPVIRAQNVKPNRIDETKLKYIDLETSKLLSRCELVKESLLITFIGAGIGEVAVFRKKKRWHLAPNVAKLEPFNEFNHNIEIDYLLFYLLSPIGRKELFKHMKSTAQPSLSMGTIRDIIVCLPPLEEQKAIVEKVNALMGLCDALAKEVQQSQEHSEMMMKSVLREVFEGEKVV